MPEFTEADTIRILVATDNHVGFEERDPIRKDDSWKTFDEIIQLARTEDVDMVLLGGDLFHDNKPSRKSMYQVMRTLRKNCLGMKPCELEFLSDANEVFDGAFSHVNYEDPDINISIPVFSIHGNHDDPSGDGHFCSLDLLQCAGLVNYFGRIPEADNIGAKPVLLQKGHTKMALYGLSNVRDERMFRTFRDNKVKWFRPGQQQSDWFNILTVHQNHHAHSATNYLPENVLPDWMNLVVWGHEHECLVDPTKNPETGFHVMQPGSSVATSLVPGEAVPKHVAVVSVTGKEFKVEKLQLKTVRPFVTRELVLATDPRFKGLEHKKENRQELTKRLMEVVDDMIEEANQDWEALQEGAEFDPEDRPLPLIRLKVEYTSPEGGKYDCENPQRFSNRFVGRVANVNDVVYFYRKKMYSRTKPEVEDLPEEAMASLDLDEAVKVESLVDEFLAAQSLKILPQAPFGDAVSQFVNKDDKHAMETFLSESLKGQQKQMLSLDPDNDDLDGAMEESKKMMEEQFAKGQLRQGKRRKVREKPEDWDSDMDGHWEDQPGVVTYEKVVTVEDKDDAPAPASRGRGRSGRGGAAAAARRSVFVDDDEDDDVFMEDVDEPPAPVKKTTARGRAAATRKTAAPKKAPAKKAPARGRKKAVFEEEEEEENDEEQEDDMFIDDDEVDEPLPPPKHATGRAAATRAPAATRKTSAAGSTTRASQAAKAGGSQATTRARATTTVATRASQRGATKQTTLNFSSQQNAVEISDDEISEDDAFETMAAPRTRRR